MHYLYKHDLDTSYMIESFQKAKSLVLICLGILLFMAFATLEDETLIISNSLGDSLPVNNTNIVLVHGSWSDGSIWSKVIPILTDAGHGVLAVQLPLHSLGEDVATVERAIERIGGPTILVGHSYGGEAITNAGYNNPNVTGLVYLAALAPDEGETGNDFFEQLPNETSKTFFENIAVDSAGFLYFNPEKFHQSFVQDIDPREADIMAAVQKPFNQSISTEMSGPAAWKQLPTWYQISENDRLIPLDIQRLYADRMNATTLSLNSSHMSLVSQPEAIAELIINATKGSTNT